ncbi:MAG: MarR family winged helix-turn-helix transcriptional regulator [Rhizomicrobium sp.]|jgi:DNA-binding MarR family transcriptional regulator
MRKPYYTVDNYLGSKAIGYLVRRLHNSMMPRAEALFGGAELTFSHWVILIGLRDGAVATCADIARHMNHDTGATTRLIDQLEERGLLARTRSKHDRRVVHLALTPEGRAMTKALLPRVVDLWNGVLKDFSHAEIDTLVDLLSRLNARMEDEPIAEPHARKAKVAL